jgi:hypothetical protein
MIVTETMRISMNLDAFSVGLRGLPGNVATRRNVRTSRRTNDAAVASLGIVLARPSSLT